MGTFSTGSSEMSLFQFLIRSFPLPFSTALLDRTPLPSFQAGAGTPGVVITFLPNPIPLRWHLIVHGKAEQLPFPMLLKAGPWEPQGEQGGTARPIVQLIWVQESGTHCWQGAPHCLGSTCPAAAFKGQPLLHPSRVSWGGMRQQKFGARESKAYPKLHFQEEQVPQLLMQREQSPSVCPQLLSLWGCRISCTAAPNTLQSTTGVL